MKHVFFPVLLVLALIISCTVSVFADDVPYTQFIQAEDLAINGTSLAVASDAGAIGGKGVKAGTKVDDAFGEGMTLKFTVPKDGQYTVWCRIFYPNVSSNSMFYSVDGGENLIWDMPDEDNGALCYGHWQYFYMTKRVSGTYSDTKIYGPWAIEHSEWRHTPNVLTLTAGEHTIHFGAREIDWIVDEFVVSELTVDQYDPNEFAAGNNAVLPECKFCGTDWKHYYSDIYEQTGETAEHYYNTVLFGTEAPEADKTADAGCIAAIAVMAFAACAVVVSRKHR